MALTEYQRDMRGCSRCSICKWVPFAQIKSVDCANGCPSISRYNFHSYSGGGRLILGLSLLEDRVELTEEVADIIYKCVMCGACEVSCKIYRDDIDVLRVIEELRFACVENGMMLPEHMMMVDAMKQEDNVFGEPKSARGDWAKGLGLKDINKEKADVLFHAGCRLSYDEGLRGVVRGAAGILKDAGADLGIAGADEACCGGRAFEVGYRGELEKYAEDFASRVKASGCGTLVTACSDCYGAFKQLYPMVGKELGVEVLHVVEYVERLMGQGRIRPTTRVPLKVTYHDPCHLGRRGEPYREWKGEDKLKRPSAFKMTGTGGVYDAPRDILGRLPGVELLEMERIREYSWCCGAGGGVMEAYPEFNSWSANQRVDEALATGAQAIVTACPWCERSFTDALEERDEDLEVLDLMELLARSLGSDPDA